jgi:Spy/CpxP family protein refolding chaperone
MNMNIRKIAFFSASCLVIGMATASGLSFAADSTAKKPAASKPVIEPGAHDMSSHDMSSHDMMVQGEESKDAAGCCGQMGGMCNHEGGMMGGQMGGMCDHKGGMMGGQMGGMCDHEAGMMGGHGGGMMKGSAHMHMIMSLDLSDEQRAKINKLSDELKHNNWATKGLIMDESAKLRDLYAAEKRDPSAIGKQYQKIFDLKRKKIEATITAQNRIEEVLTPEQRTQLRSMRRSGAPMHGHPMR